MRRSGLLHAELGRTIAAMGHKELLVIGDAGLPIPPGVPVIDLALLPGVPGFLVTLQAVLAELVVEEGIVATELAQVSPRMAESLGDLWPQGLPLREVTHERFKEELVAGARAVVRTGEFTPYSNIALTAGVAF